MQRSAALPRLPIDLEPSLTPKQAAAFLDIGLSSFWPLVHSGALPAFRVGRLIRLRPEDLRNYVAERRAVFADKSGGTA